LRFGIDREPLPEGGLGGDAQAKIARSPGNRVLIDVRGDGLLRRALEFFRRGEIRKSLRQIDSVVANCLARHLANDTLGKLCGFVADPDPGS